MSKIRQLQSVAALAYAVRSFAEEALPTAIACYQIATNSKDIEAHMRCFTEDAVMIDVRREFEGQDAIRTWAERDVIPGGDGLRHREILEDEQGYAKTEANWATWVAHCHYWWNEEGNITRMSLQYAD